MKLGIITPKTSKSNTRNPTVKDELMNLRFGAAAATIQPYENHKRKKFNNKGTASTRTHTAWNSPNR
jgi:hypothetical protein